jgi:hypothetical protein
MRPNTQSHWTDEHVDQLVEMWEVGTSVKEIADTLEKTPDSIKMYVQRHRRRLGLSKREFVRVHRAKSQCPEFDRKWYGAVPCGHWSITKPWRL